MTGGEIATRYFKLAQGIARARSAGGLRYLRDDLESAAMLGLAEAARNAARDQTENVEGYVRRTVKCRITDAIRTLGPTTRSGNPRGVPMDDHTARRATEGVVYASRPPKDRAPGNNRVALLTGAQNAISCGTGSGPMARIMRWLVVGLMLGATPAWADSTVTWPTKDEGGLTIPTRRTPVPGQCNDNTLRKCWSAEIIQGAAGNLVVDDDPQPGEVHHWTPCFRAGVGYVLAVCWNDCGQGPEAKVPTNCVGPAKPVAPGVTWP